MKNLKCPDCKKYSFLRGIYFYSSAWNCSNCGIELTISSKRRSILAGVFGGASLPIIWLFLVSPPAYRYILILLILIFPLFNKVEKTPGKRISIKSKSG